jgi:hypothetical protein
LQEFVPVVGRLVDWIDGREEIAGRGLIYIAGRGVELGEG